MVKPYLILMVGISASGKSTAAEVLADKYSAKIVSSDTLRKELYGDAGDQEHNDSVFKEFNKRIREHLISGGSVIADATNINLKSRRCVLDNVLKIECYKIAYIMTKPIRQCIEDNINRDTPVPHHVIKRQAMNFQIPFLEEGFDEILIHNYKIDYCTSVSDFINLMDGFDQQTKWHKYNLKTHCDLTAEQMHENYNIPKLVLASQLHDIGKLHTKMEGDDGNCHYYQHAEVGAYSLLNNEEAFEDYGLSKQDFLDMLFLINYHMLPFNWTTGKAIKKWKRIFGEDKFHMLIEFNQFDKIASGVEEE